MGWDGDWKVTYHLSIDQWDRRPCRSCDNKFGFVWSRFKSRIPLSSFLLLPPCCQRVEHHPPYTTTPTPSMASSSNVSRPHMSEAAANQMADEWETQVTRLIEQNDRVAWNNAQRELYEGLVSSFCHLSITHSLLSFAVTRYTGPQAISLPCRRIPPLRVRGEGIR